jgi:hypothetical protein
MTLNEVVGGLYNPNHFLAVFGDGRIGQSGARHVSTSVRVWSS